MGRKQEAGRSAKKASREVDEQSTLELNRMDARSLFLVLIALSAWCSTASAQVFVGPRSVVQSSNFRVYARSTQLANEVIRCAEESRKQLAMHWLGKELPDWPEPCPILVNDGPRTPASGETKYTLLGGGVANFQMTVSGTPERIIDSVLPHEITHTVMASYFAALGKPVPRWADEGACTTVEHPSERSKHDVMLVQYLSEGRGIPFSVLFTLKDYPPDMMPLYAQGYSLSCFLISQGGPRRFIQFLERGMETNDWDGATDEFYSYPKLGKLQTAWNRWVSEGGGVVDNYTADSLGVSTRALATNSRNAGSTVNSDPIVRTASAEPIASNPASAPVQFAVAASPKVEPTNTAMNTSSGSYYLDEFRRQQQASSQPSLHSIGDSFVPATRQASSGSASPTPQSPVQSVGLPAPFQTIGGGYVRR